MKSILAVLLVVGLASAAFPSRDAISGILKDLQQKLTQDAKQVAGHVKEDYQLALQHVQEASQAIYNKAPKESLQIVKDNLKESIQKVAADGREDSQLVIEHLKEAYQAVKAALRPQSRQ